MVEQVVEDAEFEELRSTQKPTGPETAPKAGIRSGKEFHQKLLTAQEALEAFKKGKDLYPAEVDLLNKAVQEGGELAGKPEKAVKEAIERLAKDVETVAEVATKERGILAKGLLKHKSAAGEVIKDFEHAKELGGAIKNLSKWKLAVAGGATVALGSALGIGRSSPQQYQNFEQGASRGA